MKFLLHCCLTLILLTQLAFAQVAPMASSMQTMTVAKALVDLSQQDLTSQSHTKMTSQANSEDCFITEHECLGDCQQMKTCISYCNASVFIPTLNFEFASQSHLSERISAPFWTSQTADSTPILFPPIS